MMTFGDLISSAGSGGSVFANLSTGRFKELPILQATEQIRTAFSKIIRPMLQRIELSQQEISTLSQHETHSYRNSSPVNPHPRRREVP